MRIHAALRGGASAVARLINRAYEVERFFVKGDRTSPEEVRAAMDTGTFLVGREGRGTLTACVWVDVSGEPATFGMLAVEPAVQGRGWGVRLVGAAEAHARAAGRKAMEIRAVNLREDLPPRYRRLGYVEVGTEPYEHRATTRACHFVIMRKRLADPGELD